MKAPSYFPNRLFRWFLSQQILFSSVLFVVLNGILLLWIETSGHDREVVSLGRMVVLVSVALSFMALITVSTFMTRRLVIPLGRLIEKARRLREFPFESEETEPEALTFDEPGEWYELERAVNKLGRELRSKTIRLSREKTELRAIMSAVSEAVLAVGADKKVLFYNSQFTYLFAPSPADGQVRMSEIMRVHDVIDAYETALRDGRTERREIQMSVRDQRVERVFQLSVAPLKKKHNQEVYGVVGIFYDITEMKRAEQIRIDFVANVSHELRTPLTSVAGYLQTLNGDVKKGRFEHVSEFLDVVSKNVAQLKNLVEDLLDLSALESGKELEIESLHVRDLTENVLKQVNPKAHQVEVTYGIDEIRGDGKRLEQVLRNLMENAVRYVPEGKRIDIQWLRGPTGRIELHVKDNGPGIASEHQARLFERFYRVDQDRSREKGGTGIGLSLVKHIVQRHGGNVYVRSQVGRGAEFVCEFPAPN